MSLTRTVTPSSSTVIPVALAVLANALIFGALLLRGVSVLATVLSAAVAIVVALLGQQRGWAVPARWALALPTAVVVFLLLNR